MSDIRGGDRVVDGPDYYRLADGVQLEQALWEVGAWMPGPLWDACVYMHRAGHKPGQPYDVDAAKCVHDLRFWSSAAGIPYAVCCRIMDGVLDQVYARHGNPWEEVKE